MTFESKQITQHRFYRELDVDSKALILKKIESQWSGLQSQIFSNMNTAIGRVFLLNSGAAAAVLAYLSTVAVGSGRSGSMLHVATVLFISGALLILIWHLIHHIGLDVTISRYRGDLNQFFNSEISWEELNPREPWWFVFGGWLLSVASLTCLIAGVVLSANFFI